MKLILILLISNAVYANMQKSKIDVSKDKNRGEVVDNPTLKTLSGSLNNISLYSNYVYRGGSLSDPFGAERPNIRNAEGTPSLANMSGNIGMKYRMTKNDNLSLQFGLYSTTPFHSTHDASSSRIQRDFDENHQSIDFDDPTLSYFKTYNIGNLQNISFFKVQYVTKGIYRDYGLRAALSYSHAAAYKINKFSYIAATLTYENMQYDKEFGYSNGYSFSLLPYQERHRLRGNLSTEFYLSRRIAFRFITDIFSYYRMRDDSDVKSRGLQQTIAMTYFFNRDISIAPNIRFISEDLRADRTNLGLTLNVNL